MTSETYLMDCIVGMKEYPDKYFDLAVVDPPYGINIGEKAKSFSGKKFTNGLCWDERPELLYFIELFRCSKHQIIWGANYFLDFLPSTKCMIVWDKYNTNKERFADGEIAWTSFFDRPTRIATWEWLRWYQPDMKNKQERIHPTQKPIQLYDWIFKNYAEANFKILDTHLGSGSSRIAAHKSGLHFVGFEIDEDYFQAQEKRFKDYRSQLTLFPNVPIEKQSVG